MKQKFSARWKRSRQTRKQRKYLANAPLHLRHKLIASNLSKELRKRYGRRSFPLRKNDVVKIMRGKFKGKTGKINSVDLKRLKASIEGMQNQKKDGTKVNVFFHSSKLQIQELNLEDKERMKKLTWKKAEEENKKENKENAPEKK